MADSNNATCEKFKPIMRLKRISARTIQSSEGDLHKRGMRSCEKSLNWGRWFTGGMEMVRRSRRDDLHNTRTQMKICTIIATSVDYDGSLITTATPTSAQHYGSSHAFKNILNGYRNVLY
jgi:hypothetical protein